MPLNTEQCYPCQRCQKCIQGPQYRVILLMLKVLRYIVCVKYCTMNKESNAMYVKTVKSAYRVPQYSAMLLMSEVSKVRTGLSIQSNVTHVKGVKGVEIHSMCEILYDEQRIKCYVCQRCQK